MYAVDELIDNPEMAIRAFTALKEEREKNRLLQEKKRTNETACDSGDMRSHLQIHQF